ncbi:hypothetical protein H5410_004347 [Solanum commersonii]|uniref:Reverse transcriptase n=1 Tax=Solanum commersonii TaxID=4109 RepID=A0A9J6B7F7_SOLCO|nr:hypothetical protein H5410_004347 [Solanum commersonii]
MIEKIIFWNIRSVNTKKSFERLMDLNKRNYYAFIALMEPFQDLSEIDQYRRKLGFDNAGVNCFGKNWYFWRAKWEGNIILDTVQQVTIKFRINNRCNTIERLELWDELEGIVDRELCPWVIEGDFNVILNEVEKLGGLPLPRMRPLILHHSSVHNLGQSEFFGGVSIFRGRELDNRVCWESFYRIPCKDEKGQKGVDWMKIGIFGEQFRENDYVDDYAMLDHIPRCITEEENDAMCSLPTNEEVKKVVFELNGSSVCGPDGFTGNFYQDCWEIIWSPEINHLSFADDTILLCSGDRVSVIKIMKILKDYEAISRQMVNKSKSFFYLHDKTHLIVAIRMRTLIGIRQGNFSFIYLGCPVFYGRNNSCYYEELIRKIAKRIFSWHNRFLSFGGR